MSYLRICVDTDDILYGKLFYYNYIINFDITDHINIPLIDDPKNLYLEINRYPIMIKDIKIDQQQYFILPNHDIIKIKLKRGYSFNSNYEIDTNNNSVYFPEFNSCLPEWKNDTNIFYKISNYFNSKTFRNILTQSDFIKLFFNSVFIGCQLIKLFHINVHKYNIKDYTFRQVFIRRLKPNYELNVISNHSTIYSVATSRVHHIKLNQKTYPNIIIKESNFDHRRIINDTSFKAKHLIIFRLAPQDYHHFYMPINGILVDYYYLGDDYQSVDYNFIYSNRFNPLNDNFRLILKFRYENSDNTFYLVIIGATLVGSIITKKLKINRLYKTYEHLGYFDLGGSCIVFLTNHKLNVRHELEKYNETYIKLYDQVASI